MQNGRRVTDADMKKIGLYGLETFASLCDQYHIRYYLAFGTLIGAIRHEGYIPWDDDIDILVPRTGYEKIRQLSEQFRTQDWELLSYSNEPDFLFPFMKYCHRGTLVTPSRFCTGFLYGLSIDIFPLDTTDDESESAVSARITRMKNKLKQQEVSALKYGVFNTGLINSLKRTVKHSIYRIAPNRINALRAEYRRLDELLTNESASGGRYAMYMYSPYDTVWTSKDFCGDDDQFTTVPFEGEYFTAPFDYDTVLCKIYGDYMTLPPEDKRVPKHNFTAYFR